MGQLPHWMRFTVTGKFQVGQERLPAPAASEAVAAAELDDSDPSRNGSSEPRN